MIDQLFFLRSSNPETRTKEDMANWVKEALWDTDQFQKVIPLLRDVCKQDKLLLDTQPKTIKHNLDLIETQIRDLSAMVLILSKIKLKSPNDKVVETKEYEVALKMMMCAGKNMNVEVLRILRRALHSFIKIFERIISLSKNIAAREKEMYEKCESHIADFKGIENPLKLDKTKLLEIIRYEKKFVVGSEIDLKKEFCFLANLLYFSIHGDERHVFKFRQNKWIVEFIDKRGIDEIIKDKDKIRIMRGEIDQSWLNDLEGQSGFGGKKRLLELLCSLGQIPAAFIPRDSELDKTSSLAHVVFHFLVSFSDKTVIDFLFNHKDDGPFEPYRKDDLRELDMILLGTIKKSSNREQLRKIFAICKIFLNTCHVADYISCEKFAESTDLYGFIYNITPPLSTIKETSVEHGEEGEYILSGRKISVPQEINQLISTDNILGIGEILEEKELGNISKFVESEPFLSSQTSSEFSSMQNGLSSQPHFIDGSEVVRRGMNDFNVQRDKEWHSYITFHPQAPTNPHSEIESHSTNLDSAIPNTPYSGSDTCSKIEDITRSLDSISDSYFLLMQNQKESRKMIKIISKSLERSVLILASLNQETL